MRRVLAGFVMALGVGLLGFVALVVRAEPGNSMGDISTILGTSSKGAVCARWGTEGCTSLRYHILVANAGAHSLDVTVLDPLPPFTQYVPGSASPPRFLPQPETRSLRWVGSVAANSAITLSFEVVSLASEPITTTNEVLICVLPERGCITRTVSASLYPSGGPTATPTPSVTVSPSPAVSPTSPPVEPTVTSTPTAMPTMTPSATPTRLFFWSLPLLVRAHSRPSVPTATATPSWPVAIDAVWMEGPKGLVNHEFRRCEVLYEWVQLTNYSAAPAAIWLDWIVSDWSGRPVPSLSYANWQVVWPSGTYRANLPRAIPSNAGLGPYMLTVRLRGEGGLRADRVVYFTITDDEPIMPPLADMAVCKGISPAGLPVDVESRFKSTDAAVFVWGWWQRAGKIPHTLRWEWIAPDGAVHSTYEATYVEACTYYAWAWLEIAGTEVARMSGVWEVQARYDGELVGARRFEIIPENASGDDAGVAMTGGGYLTSDCAGGATCMPLPSR